MANGAVGVTAGAGGEAPSRLAEAGSLQLYRTDLGRGIGRDDTLAVYAQATGVAGAAMAEVRDAVHEVPAACRRPGRFCTAGWSGPKTP